MYYQTKALFTRIALDDLDFIITNLETKTIQYQKPTVLFYEGQIPIVGYIIVDGEVSLSRNKKIKNILKKGFIFGVRELFHNGKVSMEAKVSTMAQIIFIDRSMLHEILDEKHGEQLKTLFQTLVFENFYEHAH